MKEFINKIGTFCINRLAEFVGITIVALSIFLMISLISYSPEDPNFIFTDNTEIKNIMGSKGSFISDLLYQSFGLISVLIPITFLFTGINIILTKKFLILIENAFFSILYIIFGCLFFSAFYIDSYWLVINGNNGFIGNLFDKTFILSFIQNTTQISFYTLILLISLIFLKSINFRMPEGAPPYEPNEDAEHTDQAYKAIKGIMSMGNHQWAREKALINLLQSIPPNDAELFVAMKDKKVNEMFPNVTEDLVKEVWPELVR